MITEPKRYTADNPLKILSLGWGVQSWTLAAMAALDEIPRPDIAVHSDTTHEMAGTYSHAAKWTPWLEERGIPVVTVQAAANRVGAVSDASAKAVFIPAYTTNLQGEHGQSRRQCTADWKIAPIRRFIRELIPKPRPGMVESWQGISLDEWQRMRTSDVAYITNIYPLVDQRISRADCVAWLDAHGLDVPPKSACTFCPYHSPDHWKRLKQAGGADWDEAVTVDEAIRDKRPNHTLFIHRAGLPLEVAVRIPEDYGAKQMEMEIPCDSGHCFV